jgi:hypothetical protein
MDDWDQGDRRIVCGLSQWDRTAARTQGLFPTFTGDVRGADQSLVYSTGTCLSKNATTVLGTVACASPHEAVAVGSITLPGGPDAIAPTADQFDALAQLPCLKLAQDYFGAAFDNTTSATTDWLPIAPDSWNAGSRSFTCTVLYTTAGGAPRAVTGDPQAGTAAGGA